MPYECPSSSYTFFWGNNINTSDSSILNVLCLCLFWDWQIKICGTCQYYLGSWSIIWTRIHSEFLQYTASWLSALCVTDFCSGGVERRAQKKSPHFWSEGDTPLLPGNTWIPPDLHTYYNTSLLEKVVKNERGELCSIIRVCVQLYSSWKTNFVSHVNSLEGIWIQTGIFCACKHGHEQQANINPLSSRQEL